MDKQVMKYIIGILIILSVFIFNHKLVRAEDQVRTIDSEITRLAKQYLVNEKKARAIINCESQMYAQAINVNKNKTIDYSYWQINNFWWGESMEKEGFDIQDPEENLEAGFYILSEYGDKPWIWSKPCWSKLTKI